MASFDPSIAGIFIFGLLAGICPCNSVLCMGVIGYLTGSEEQKSLLDTLKLTLPFSAGTIIVLAPLGAVAGIVGRYMLFLSDSVAWGIGGVLIILMGLQLLHVYKPPIRSIFNLFRGPKANTAKGTFLLGLSFGAITIGRAAPMLVVVLTYIGLYQSPVQGLLTTFIYAVGMSVPLLIISSVGGTFGGKIKHLFSDGGKIIDVVSGVALILIGFYFCYLALL